MNLFSEIEKTIERGFRRAAERMFGPAESDELVLVHRAILEEIAGKVQAGARGERIFPYPQLKVTLNSDNPDRRALYQTAFAEEGRLEKDVRDTLEATGCRVPRGFVLEIATSGDAGPAYRIEYGAERKSALSPALNSEPARIVVVKGKAENPEYKLNKPRTNIGRMAELSDSEHRVVRRNDIAFEEGDEANATVSRKHAHIRSEGGEYRIVDDESEFGTRVFRDGRSIEVPAGNRRGEKLRPGDEIYLGRACLRFE